MDKDKIKRDRPRISIEAMKEQYRKLMRLKPQRMELVAMTALCRMVANGELRTREQMLGIVETNNEQGNECN